MSSGERTGPRLPVSAAMKTRMAAMLLEMSKIDKFFPGVNALSSVDFSVAAGEIHALMGENGAGKSTLIKILTGLYEKDGGSIVFNGAEVSFGSTLEAQEAGISTVYQELNMIPYLSVSENLFLGRYREKATGIDWKELHDRARELTGEMKLHIDVKAPLFTYGTAVQQMISIIRAISLNCKLLVMDEATSSLDAAETQLLFEALVRLRARGISTIFITHRLDEVYQVCDRITVLKDGVRVGCYFPQDLPQYELINKMVGREVSQEVRPGRDADFSDKETIVELEHVSLFPKVRDVSLHIRRGEVVGLAGLLGSERTETAELIFGCVRPDAGSIKILGKPVAFSAPKDALARGLAFCTENRREEGLLPNMTVRDNIVASTLKRVSSHGFVDMKKCSQVAREYVGRLKIKTPSIRQLIKNLSGGNQQKTILARWLATDPKLIILDEPTRGIDVGAKREVEKMIEEFIANGIGVLYISSELSELVRNCNRVVVMRDGKTIGQLVGNDLSEDAIMQMIAAEATESMRLV